MNKSQKKIKGLIDVKIDDSDKKFPVFLLPFSSKVEDLTKPFFRIKNLFELLNSVFLLYSFTSII